MDGPEKAISFTVFDFAVFTLSLLTRFLNVETDLAPSPPGVQRQTRYQRTIMEVRPTRYRVLYSSHHVGSPRHGAWQNGFPHYSRWVCAVKDPIGFRLTITSTLPRDNALLDTSAPTHQVTANKRRKTSREVSVLRPTLMSHLLDTELPRTRHSRRYPHPGPR